MVSPRSAATALRRIFGASTRAAEVSGPLTVADDRDGALSGSTLKEANSWGKVDLGAEQMVYAEATVALPLLAGYAYHKGNWKNRRGRNYTELLDRPSASARRTSQ